MPHCSDNVLTRHLVNDTSCWPAGLSCWPVPLLTGPNPSLLLRRQQALLSCIFPQLPRTETVTKCVHGRMLSVWCCNHNPDAGLPADATSAEDHCCVGPLEWQPAAPGCLQQHFHRVQQLSNRANCAAGEEQSTTATLQNYESSLLRLQNYQKVLLAAAAEPRGEASVTDSKCLLNSGAPHLLLNFKVRVVCLLLYTPL